MEEKKSVVDEITALGNRLNGDMVPPSWYKHIRFKEPGAVKDDGKWSDKVDLLGVLILADIMYWYRAGRKGKKFQADKLQRSYQDYVDKFNVSKKQVREAIDRLEEAGYITTEFRNFKPANSSFLSNVLFVEPVPKMIEGITPEGNPSYPGGKGVLPSTERPSYPGGKDVYGNYNGNYRKNRSNSSLSTTKKSSLFKTDMLGFGG